MHLCIQLAYTQLAPSVDNLMQGQLQYDPKTPLHGFSCHLLYEHKQLGNNSPGVNKYGLVLAFMVVL